MLPQTSMIIRLPYITETRLFFLTFPWRSFLLVMYKRVQSGQVGLSSAFWELSCCSFLLRPTHRSVGQCSSLLKKGPRCLFCPMFWMLLTSASTHRNLGCIQHDWVEIIATFGWTPEDPYRHTNILKVLYQNTQCVRHSEAELYLEMNRLEAKHSRSATVTVLHNN